MPTTRQKASNKAQADRLREVGRRRMRLINQQKGGQLLPDRLLKALAASNLPNDMEAYNARLQELSETA